MPQPQFTVNTVLNARPLKLEYVPGVERRYAIIRQMIIATRTRLSGCLPSLADIDRLGFYKSLTWLTL